MSSIAGPFILGISEKPQAASRIARALDEKNKPTMKKVANISVFVCNRDGKKIVVAPALGHLFSLSSISKTWNYPVLDYEWVPSYIENKNLKTKNFIDAFKILSKNNSDEFEGIFNYEFPLEIKSKSYIIIDFELEEFVKQPTSDKDINYISLDAGNYSMFAYFYYGNDSDFEEIKSNEVDFEIIAEKRPDMVNLTVNIELAKTEFVVNELITGWINISNDNLFDILVENNITMQRYHGDHLLINSIENHTLYRAIIDSINYPIRIKAQNFTVIEFKLDSVFKLPIASKDLTFINLSAGSYSIFAFFYYGNLTDFIKIESNLVLFRINEVQPNQSGNITPLEPLPGNNNKPAGTSLYYSLTGLFVVITIIITIFISSTEVGKFGFFGAIAPLYTKRRRKKDENYGYKKGLIQGYIDGNPGENYNSIKRALDLNNGTLAYYLRVLMREEKIIAERDGTYKRFYPTRGKDSKIIFDLSEIQKKIYNFIKTNPGSFQKDISAQLELIQSKVNYHVNLMVDARILTLEREGNKTKCYVLEEAS